MPWKRTKITRGPNRGKYRVTGPSGTKAKATTSKKADAMIRLGRALDRGWKPTSKRRGGR